MMAYIAGILIFTWMIVRLGDVLFSLIDVLIEYLIVMPVRIFVKVLFGYDD